MNRYLLLSEFFSSPEKDKLLFVLTPLMDPSVNMDGNSPWKDCLEEVSSTFFFRKL